MIIMFLENSMSRETIVYADSTQRDTTLYPYGNSYTLHLTTPIKNITKVELVSAIVPNTMYNLTSCSNCLQVDSYGVSLNPGFYSASSLTGAINASQQLPNATIVYMPGEGRFALYGNFASVSVSTAEASKILGLPFGTTPSSNVMSNQEFARMWTNAYTFVESSSVINFGTSEYAWLDIEEFRTPLTTDARQLVTLTSGQKTTNSNTSATSFALIPMDVNSGGYKSFKEYADYKVSVEFPSRLDSLDRLTIRWRDRYGALLNFHGLDTNSFALRIHTTIVPVEPERIEQLPAPSRGMMDKSKLIMIIAAALLAGLVLLLLMRHSVT